MVSTTSCTICGRYSLALLLLLCLSSLSAQDPEPPNDNSPFASLGIGNFLDQNYLYSGNMGGVSAAFQDPYQWSSTNPASLAYLKSTSFQVAAYAERSRLRTIGSPDAPSEDAIVWNGNIRYLGLGMPLRNSINLLEERKEQSLGVGMGISLLPYTRTAQSTRITTTDPIVGDIQQDIVRQGGTYKLQWSGGIHYKNIAIGVNAGYFFGTLQRSQFISLPDDNVRSLITIKQSKSQLGGFVMGYGAMYTIPLSKRISTSEDDSPDEWRTAQKRLVLGVSGNLSTDFTSKNFNFDRTGRAGVNQVDTARFSQDVKFFGKLPSETRFGISYINGRRLHIGAEYSLGQWSEFINEADPQVLNDSYRMSVGVTWRPDPSDVLSFWNRIGYQAGYYRGRDPRSLDGAQLEYWGITAGFEIPVVYTRQISHFQVGLEYGAIDSRVITDRFLRLNLGMTFNDNKWFLKRKYD